MKIKFSKNIFLLLACIIFFCFGCSSVEVESNSDTQFPIGRNQDIYLTKSSEISKEEDPFILENVQRIYDVMCQEHSRGDHSFFKLGKKLKATHHGIYVRPSSVEEAIRLMRDNRIAIQCNYVGGQKDSEDIDPFSRERLWQVEPCEKNNDSFFYSDDLYVVWPINVPIPDTLKWRAANDLYLPDFERIERGETPNEELDFVNRIVGNQNSSIYYGQSGTLMFYDEFLDDNVTASTLKLRIQLGSSFQDISVTNGHFQLPGWYPVNATLSFYMQQEQFTVVTGDVTGAFPQVYYLGQINDLWDVSSPYSTYDGVVQPYNNTRIYRAADFFFEKVNSESPYFDTLDHIIIYSLNSSSNEYAGLFYNTTVPYIEIFSSGSASNYVIGSVLHELGHSVQYKETNGHYSNVITLLKESFACFIGWYYGEMYYSSKGYSAPNASSFVNDQNRQTWIGENSPYSPLFIDLFDTFNQHNWRNYTLNDPIDQAVSLPLIRNLSRCETFNSFLLMLNNNTSLTDSEWDYFDTYETWLSAYGN